MVKLNRINIILQVVVVMLFLGSSTVLASIIIVDTSGGGDYLTIQEAIDAATTLNGDTIVVKNGTYTENITVSKQLIITSENGYASTTVIAEDSNTHAFDVIMVGGVTISGFTIYGATGAYKAGIYVRPGANNCTFTENRCGYDIDHKNYLGIYLISSGGHLISSNFSSYNIQGILISGSSGNTLTANTCIDNAIGIKLDYASTNNTIIGNHCEGHNAGIWLASSDENMITDNTFNSNREGIRFYDSHANIVSGNSCLNNSYGIYLSQSNGPITLTAGADDFEDGDISADITWISNLDGPITSPAILSVGTHTLTAGVTDSGGLTGSDLISITITP